MQVYEWLLWFPARECQVPTDGQDSPDDTGPRWRLTFALEAFLPQDADQGQELGDLFQVENGGVVELDDGHGLLVVGTAAAVLPQAGAGGKEKKKIEG